MYVLYIVMCMIYFTTLEKEKNQCPELNTQ